MKKWKQLISLLIALTMVFSLAACGSSSSDDDTDSTTDSSTEESSDTSEDEEESDEEESSEPKTLTVGTLDATDTFDPCSNSDCGLGITLVYDTVLTLNYDTMEVEAGIATDWEWLDDTTLVLTIRDDAVFSNGDVLTPSDVLYSLSRFVYENDQFDPGYDNIDFDNCTIDGNELTIVLYEVDADFLYELANDRWASVVCEAYVTENPDSWWDAPCGTGPYICTENVDGSHSSYERRDDYWGDLPDAETITILHYSESTTMLADFENGVLDIALDVPEDDYLSAVDGGYGDVGYQLFQTWDLLAVCLPEYTEYFQNELVREAISLALDTTAIANAVYGSLGQVADSILIDGVAYYSSIGVHEYDPDAAIELLAEAGYSDGFTILCVIPSTTTNEKTATIVQEYLAQIGITMEIEIYDFATAIPILMADGTDISIFGTGGGTYLASSILATIGETSTNSGSRVSDETFNSFINNALTTLDEDEREAQYLEAQQWAYDNYWTLPIAYAQAAVLYQSNISNVVGLTARSVDLVQIAID